MAGATQESIKAMPAFAYTNDNTTRDQFMSAAEKDIALGKTRVAELEKKAGAANADAKARISGEIASLQTDVKAAESRLGEMRQAATGRWREFEAGVTAATTHLRKSLETTNG
jgi:hypothetical protein